jgi:uroporphyrinogen-III synthase
MATTLLLTRPRAQSDRFAAMCRPRLPQVGIVISPILEIEPIGTPPDLRGYRGLILTSENALTALSQPVPADLVAYCVGDRTAEAARQAGLTAHSVGGSAEDLYAALAGAEGPLLHLHGVHARGELASRLTEAGTPTEEAVVYDQLPRPLSGPAKALLSGTSPVLLPLFSPRSARLLSDAAKNAVAPLFLAAMSEAVAAAWAGPAPALVRSAERPAAPAMLDLLSDLSTAASP